MPRTRSLREELADEGYVVLRGLVPAVCCDNAVAAIAERTGLVWDDPATWSDVEIPLNQVPVWGHQAIWDLRQHPALHAAMAEVWGTPALWVTVDTCNFTVPYRDGLPDALEMHWDGNPREPNGLVQGVLALVDTPADGGGFRCAPSWRNAPERWPERWEQAEWGEQYEIVPLPDEVVQVPAGKGDLILWQSSMPHGTVRNRSDRPRVALYVSMLPAGPIDSPEARQRVADFESGMIAEWWRWKPGHDVPQPGAPATLTELGEKLLGRRNW